MSIYCENEAFLVILIRFRHEVQHSFVQWLLLLAAESVQPRFLGMVDTILQRFNEQSDTDNLVALRSAKLSINVLHAHWHHVRTTDTVIVVSSYKTFLDPSPLSFRPTHDA